MQSQKLRSLIAGRSSCHRWYGPDDPRTRAAELAVERQKLAEDRERVTSRERKVASLERQVIA